MSAPLCLVALEDPHERSSIASLLWSRGFEVRQVSSADMALRILRRGRPIDLAVAEDEAVVTRARIEGLGTRFLVVSKDARESIRTHELGRVHFVERPLDEGHLVEAVAKLLGERTWNPTFAGARR